MRIIKGQTVLVTGASRGIGVAIATAFAERGLNLVLTARRDVSVAPVAQNLSDRYGITAHPMACDMRNHDQIAALADHCATVLGGIDILVNNAGIDHTMPFDDRSSSDIVDMIETNLTGPMLLAHAIVPAMIARDGGHIVNIASLAGVMPSAYEEPYNASKYGLVGFTKSLRLSAQDQGWPISASAICPGFVSGAGIYEAMKSDYGISAPASMGTVSDEKVAQAVIRAVEKDLPDIVIMRGQPRLLAALAIVAPQFFERIIRWSDSSAPFRTVAQARAASRPLTPR